MSTTFTKRDASAPPGLFASEARGLDWLRSADAIAVPRVIEVDDHHITIERVDVGAWTPTADERLGRQLAALHRAGAPRFGARWRGFIGPAPMPNDEHDDWAAFYATCRVEPFVVAIPHGERDVFARALARIATIAGPPEPPARIHGDLWRGNVLADRMETPWLIDPAAHGGHRETDLAMMRLFGGFGERAYRAYDETFPLAAGWDSQPRIALHQLHPLLVHAHLFGGHYVAQAIAAARACG